MRLLIQRVNYASVSINNSVYSSIKNGLLVLCGIEELDDADDINWLVQKLVNLRIFPDENKLMNLSTKDLNYEILFVSQFTLHASTKKGNRPSFIRAAKPEKAKQLYNNFVEALKSEIGVNLKCGIFAADMKVKLENDGPVTIFIDSKSRE
ncbi:MAG: D-aminoacyl-tRNA deacylase [Bacteroidota bacterium]|jgi:D-tyrosyl-tRNA(Tyr) deacylase